MRLRDIALFLSAILGMAGGVLFPAQAELLTPVVLYFMMGILFMAFLKIDFNALYRIGPDDLKAVALWTMVKLLALPMGLFFVAKWLAPDYAVAVLLLSGVSTGVTAPFFSSILGADTPRVLQLTVITSVLVPLSLPLLVKLLLHEQLTIPFWAMMRMLAMVIFVPLILAVAGRRFLGRLMGVIDRASFWLSLTAFCAINLGVFSQYSGFLGEKHLDVLIATAVATLAALVYALVGFTGALVNGRFMDGLPGAVSQTFINNVLVIVFASRFFGEQAPLLAAMYMVPYFGMLIPLGWLARRNGIVPARTV